MAKRKAEATETEDTAETTETAIPLCSANDAELWATSGNDRRV